MFGWRVAGIYHGTGLLIAMLTGWVMGRLRMERHLEEWVYQAQFGEQGSGENGLSWEPRLTAGVGAVREIVGRVLPFLRKVLKKTLIATVIATPSWRNERRQS